MLDQQNEKIEALSRQVKELSRKNGGLKSKITNHEKIRKQEILGIRKRYEAAED